MTNLKNVKVFIKNQKINLKNEWLKNNVTKAKVEVDNSPCISYTLGMKEKKLIVIGKDISQKQWSNLILELNLIKKAWSSYATIELQGPGVRKIIAHGTRNFDSRVIEED